MRCAFVLLCLISFRLGAAPYDPVGLFLTWRHSPETSMSVGWITDPTHPEDVLEYKKSGDACWKQVSGAHASLPEQQPFFIHHAELLNLTPDTLYDFRVHAEGVVYKFQTMPAIYDKPLRFVVGGDLYPDQLHWVVKMNRQVALLNPQFIVIGGDFAYHGVNPKHTECRWIDLLATWKRDLITSDGKLIPIIPVIGNHELHKVKKGNSPEAPYYKAFFPGSEYSAVDFGNYLSLILLDSGHLNPISGAQTAWLEEALKARQQIPHKMVVYHVAAFPSVRSFNGQSKPEIRRAWVPLFEKYGIEIAFEHHDHAYKRTFPLLRGKVHPHGILYIGDGGWGVEKARAVKSPFWNWYLAKTVASRNIVFVQLHKQSMRITAYDDDGKVIDDINN